MNKKSPKWTCHCINQDECTWGGRYENSTKDQPRLGARKAFWASDARGDPKEAELTKKPEEQAFQAEGVARTKALWWKDSPNPAMVHNNPYPSVNFELEGKRSLLKMCFPFPFHLPCPSINTKQHKKVS